MLFMLVTHGLDSKPQNMPHIQLADASCFLHLQGQHWQDIFHGIAVLILGISPRWTTNDLLLRSLTTGGICPGDNNQAEKESMRKRIQELQDLELELATQYRMASFWDIDSVEVFDEAKSRAFSNNAQCIQEAEWMYELYMLRYRRATYPGGF
ncbi:hypothetical protein F5146DRAFT_997589 [Armillaria mellea]|nr:hypothetical protein F5146DRAFT_997589 [Armillaria mellea]